MGNHALKITKKGHRYWIAMEPRALTAPLNIASDRTRQRKRENPTLRGVKGTYPIGLLPQWGERGSPSQFPRQLEKKSERDFYRAEIFLICP